MEDPPPARVFVSQSTSTRDEICYVDVATDYDPPAVSLPEDHPHAGFGLPELDVASPNFRSGANSPSTVDPPEDFTIADLLSARSVSITLSIKNISFSSFKNFSNKRSFFLLSNYLQTYFFFIVRVLGFGLVFLSKFHRLFIRSC